MVAPEGAEAAAEASAEAALVAEVSAAEASEEVHPAEAAHPGEAEAAVVTSIPFFIQSGASKPILFGKEVGK